MVRWFGGSGRGGARGVIGGLSDRSVRRLVFTALNAGEDWVAMVTLTYPSEFPMSGEVSKRHLNRFLTGLRRLGEGMAYLWVLEFQARGAAHYHILVNQYVDHGWVAEEWYRIVGSEDARHRQAGTSVVGVRNHDAVSKYLAKYLGKDRQKGVPVGFAKVGRFWGCTRGLVPAPESFTLEGKGGQDVARQLRRWIEGKMGRKLVQLRGMGGFVVFDGAAVAHRLGVRSGGRCLNG